MGFRMIVSRLSSLCIDEARNSDIKLGSNNTTKQKAKQTFGQEHTQPNQLLLFIKYFTEK